jgi:hypothetical protein
MQTPPSSTADGTETGSLSSSLTNSTSSLSWDMDSECSTSAARLSRPIRSLREILVEETRFH